MITYLTYMITVIPLLIHVPKILRFIAPRLCACGHEPRPSEAVSKDVHAS